MKLCRKIPAYLLLTCLMLFLTACGDKKPEATTVYVDKKSNLKQILVDREPSYSVADLQDFTDEKIASYMEENEEGEVQLISCEEKEGHIYAELSYGSGADYEAFNGLDCFLGTLEEALAAEAVPADALSGADGSVCGFADLLAEHPEYHILMLRENTQVETYHRILYTAGQVTLSGEKSAVIGDGDSATSGYFPRKIDAPAYLIFE